MSIIASEEPTYVIRAMMAKLEAKGLEPHSKLPRISTSILDYQSHDGRLEAMELEVRVYSIRAIMA